MKKNIKRKNIKLLLKLIFIIILYLLILNAIYDPKKINISLELSVQHQKYWVGEKYKIIIKKNKNCSKEKIHLKSLYNKTNIISNEYVLMKSSGRECIIAFIRNIQINSSICITIYNTPKLNFKEISPIKIETNKVKKINLDIKDYPRSNIKYESNHPDVIKVNNKGKIIAMRPGNAIITAFGLDGKNAKVEVIVISNNGLISNYTLDQYNASLYQKVMIVAHPDDETLWGGAHLFKDKFFLVCLTNGYNLERANDYREILKFTHNNGIILNYPDLQDNIINDWSEVRNGILKDLSTILNYKYWEQIITHGPDGTTGHIHHKKICEYVTKIAKESNEYNNLYYFGKFYKINKIPNNLPRINDEELEYKKKEIKIYKSVISVINNLFWHMLPYENWILASKWKE